MFIYNLRLARRRKACRNFSYNIFPFEAIQRFRYSTSSILITALGNWSKSNKKKKKKLLKLSYIPQNVTITQLFFFPPWNTPSHLDKHKITEKKKKKGKKDIHPSFTIWLSLCGAYYYLLASHLLRRTLFSHSYNKVRSMFK